MTQADRFIEIAAEGAAMTFAEDGSNKEGRVINILAINDTYVNRITDLATSQPVLRTQAEVVVDALRERGLSNGEVLVFLLQGVRSIFGEADADPVAATQCLKMWAALAYTIIEDAKILAGVIAKTEGDLQ